MKILSLFLFVLLFCFANVAQAASPSGKNWSRASYTKSCPNGRVGTKCIQLGSVSLTWDHPTQRQDGSALSYEEISHYVISIQKDGGPEVHHAVSKSTGVTLKHLPQGNYTFSIRTVDSDNAQGPFSTPVVTTI